MKYSKSVFEQECAKVLEIDNDVHNCNLCLDLVEKFGIVYEIEYGIKVIPIYHPSPMAPLSYKGNLPIFNKIKEIC